MKLLFRIQFSKSFGLLAAGFLLLCTGLTGCADREAQFLTGEEFADEEEISVEEIPAGENSAGKVPAEDEAKDSGSGNASVIPEQVQAEIYVDVCGAVANPGVYALDAGSRVFQAIEAAGGYLPEAAMSYVNRAQGLTDGQQVYIPTQEEIDSQLSGTGETQPGGSCTTGNTQPGSFVPGSTQPGDGSFVPGNPQPDSGKVNLNTADEAALTTLTGIGASKARAIIAYREANGPYQAIEDIMKVEGIKEGTFAKIKDDIVVG